MMDSVASSMLKVAVVGAGAAVCAALTYARMKRKPKVVITGGSGNLGSKLATHLCKTGLYEVILLEHPDYHLSHRTPEGATVVECDVATHGPWIETLRGAYAVVHFSAVNPYPNASWRESAESMSHAFHVLCGSARLGVRRVVLASSNHVMGGYKDLPHAKIKPTDPPACGTMLLDATALAKSGNAVAYAAAKLAAERLAETLAPTSGTEFLTLRIGWCQPGDNSPSTLSAGGVPPDHVNDECSGGSVIDAPTENVDEDWFKGMWLSNQDFVSYFDAALRVPLQDPQTHYIVNAMSKNSGARWCLEDTERILNVKALDDVRASS